MTEMHMYGYCLQLQLIKLKSNVTFLGVSTRRRQREGQSMITVVRIMLRKMPLTKMVSNEFQFHWNCILATHYIYYSKDSYKHARSSEIS